jgi:hypothetical protein
MIGHQQATRRERTLGLKLNSQALERLCTPAVEPLGALARGYSAAYAQDEKMGAALESSRNQNHQAGGSAQSLGWDVTGFHVWRKGRVRLVE